MINMQVSLCLPEATADIEFGDGDDNNDDVHHHHHHHINLGRAAAVSNASTRTLRQPHGKRGRIRPGPGGSGMMMIMLGLGLGLGLVEKNKYYSLPWIRGNTLPHRIPKLSMMIPCYIWAWRTRPVRRHRLGWLRWIVCRMPYPCCDYLTRREGMIPWAFSMTSSMMEER